jgi:hypothetical protein
MQIAIGNNPSTKKPGPSDPGLNRKFTEPISNARYRNNRTFLVASVSAVLSFAK